MSDEHYMPALTPYLFCRFENNERKKIFLYVSIKTPTGINLKWTVRGKYHIHSEEPSVGVSHFLYCAELEEDKTAFTEQIRTYRFEKEVKASVECESRVGSGIKDMGRFFFHVDIDDKDFPLLDSPNRDYTARRKCGVAMAPEYTSK